MDIINKINKLITDTIAVGDVESNLAKGSVDIVGGKCPEGQKWCPKKKECVPIGSGDGKRKDETSVVGGSYVDSATVNIIGSGQTRVGGEKDKEIEILKTKVPDLVTRFNKLLGAYVVDDKKGE